MKSQILALGAALFLGALASAQTGTISGVIAENPPGGPACPFNFNTRVSGLMVVEGISPGTASLQYSYGAAGTNISFANLPAGDYQVYGSAAGYRSNETWRGNPFTFDPVATPTLFASICLDPDPNIPSMDFQQGTGNLSNGVILVGTSLDLLFTAAANTPLTMVLSGNALLPPVAIPGLLDGDLFPSLLGPVFSTQPWATTDGGGQAFTSTPLPPDGTLIGSRLFLQVIASSAFPLPLSNFLVIEFA